MIFKCNPHQFNKFGKKLVSTFNAFNTRPTQKLNFTKEDTVSRVAVNTILLFDITLHSQGLFNISELKTCDGFYLLKERAVHKTEDLINEATSQNRQRKMVLIFDELSDTLCKVADLSEFIRLAHPAFTYSAAAEDACISISGIVEK